MSVAPAGIQARIAATAADPDRASRLARRLGLVSAGVVAVSTLALVTDFAVAVARAGPEKARIETLQEQARSDFEAAALLHDERERQTDRSLAREARGRILAWVLLVSTALFVACGKGYMSVRPQRLPALEELVSVRFPRSPPGAIALEPRPSLPSGDPGGLDLGVVDALVSRFGHGREMAVPILQAIQGHYRYLPDDALKRVCELTEITPAQIAGTSSFYARFRRSPVGLYVVRVCHGTACHVAGAEQITRELRRHLEIAPDADTDPRRLFTLDAVACLGCCSLAPVMMIEQETAGHLTPVSAREALDALAAPT